MDEKQQFDFWYAVNNTEIVRMPTQHLETFGSTILNYHLVSELMDTADQVRVREGRMQANRPQVITPEAYSTTFLEGFGEEAHKYIDWLKSHEQDVRILQYGYRLKQEAFSEHVMTDNIEAVVDRVKSEINDKNDPLAAIAVGVDTPWDVCLVKLFWEIIQSSAHTNIRELEGRRMFESIGGIPRAVHEEIEQAFLAASRDAALVNVLYKKLQDYHLFEQHEDRFFALVKTSRQG